MNQRTLFGDAGRPRRSVERIELPDAALTLHADFLGEREADALFAQLRAETPWQREEAWMFGRLVAAPRLTAWYGDPESVYVYSGMRHEPMVWTSELGALRERIEARLDERFNSVLLNFYRSGHDSVGWHADDEPELGDRPCIASLSLGAERVFQLKHRWRDDVERIDVPLPHGSLLVMAGDCQRAWKHQLPKRVGRNDPGPRINLTFRRIRSDAEPGQSPPDAPQFPDARDG